MTAPAGPTAAESAELFAVQRAALADVVAIPVTPFDAEDRLDQDTYRALVRRLLDAGVRTLTPNGNTSEFYSLTPEERRLEVELTIAEAGREARIIVGVGQEVPTAVAAAVHAREAGARMVMVHQPVHPYVSRDGWVDYHRHIARAVPELGVVPYIRNPLISGAAIARLGEECPNVIGVKYAVPDPVRFAAVARDAGLERFVWVAGLAELSAPAYFACGATGFTSGLVNVVPEVSIEMLHALRAGDYPAAMKVWELIRPFEELRAERQSANNVTVVKEALAALGLCRRDIRPPSAPLPEAERDAVAAIVEGWDAR
ncbi:dihydrodipicolinate synthase family protein [Streptomyces litchfieldiae]|uniref:Dihydrodipicolinate synthase family protein n=1 Tax=Streptomyces litchfieldiae TaxID=3075543 RepID=A0ABU2MRB2_9ACTN|nr:dihydrodipicolinate synthase family protein [Streptomyces sp. DSM 44938]MDT0343947.1 dihydrodipicolinate synthase family protein [Streptomyces sp. DSM 44938]